MRDGFIDQGAYRHQLEAPRCQRRQLAFEQTQGRIVWMTDQHREALTSRQA
jgi:hypothetical protein